MYITRSKLNVDHSDGTIAFRTHKSFGTDKTIGYCLTKKWSYIENTDIETKYKPCLIIKDLSLDKFDIIKNLIKSFIINYNIKILNICGHRTDVRLVNPSYKHRIKMLLNDSLKYVIKISDK